ncbi:carbamate kinase [Longimicrobium terrae]|uniref:Carbamate kinase n=1 Tax=Longimicrobium terrae TaxID=1639882 RepID=A0A841H054_9BACT|nr:carbamate kinase [Longimicrobium terrae]MBB6071334.1 carbamate kinase [Longimicrobium terrae]NNC31447.1 carbamate kinase [Longimicrobium terrae]
MPSKTVVLALGGNALAQPGEEGTITEQFRHTRESLGAVVELAREGWRIAIVHGNGPQVGNELIRNEQSRHLVPPLPLGVLVAGTEGWIGYMIQQSLQNALLRGGVDRQVVTMVTQVLVDPDDPEMQRPSKPIGRTMDEATARELAAELGGEVAETKGGWRRVVPSPRPTGIVERDMIRALVAEGHVVVAAGGGGCPVYRHPEFGLEGVDAVVDKDRAAAILGRDIGAEVLVILTDVDRVYVDYGTPRQRGLERLTVAEADALLAGSDLGKGSMAPKVEAAAEFVRRGGKRAIIARLDQGREAVAGNAGTEIVP